MKFFILLVTFFATIAWAQDEVVNMDAPNMKLGLYSNPKQTEGTVNERFHGTAETSSTGGTSATCPECGDPIRLPEKSDYSNNANDVELGTKADGQQ